MKKSIIYIAGLAVLFVAGAGCKKYLDINSDPDTTQSPSNSSVLPQCLAAMATGLQSDGGLYVAKYTQNWFTSASTSASILYDQQGYSWSGGTMAATWTLLYTAMGGNLNYMIENGIKGNTPVFTGVALALKAWSFQHATDYNSDLPFYDAFKDTTAFHYDTQEAIYKGVDSLCRLSLSYLNQVTDPTVSSSKLAIGDMVYNGDIAKWKKFVYGVLARNWHHQTNKASYNADSVIKYCDNAMAAVTDDFCVPFDATVNNNSNYFGTFRDNMGAMRFSNFIVKLLDGTILSGSNAFNNRDPRMAFMLSASQDTTNGNGGYRGVDPAQGDPYITLTGTTYTVGSANWINARKRVATPWGDSIYANPSAAIFNNATGKYLFQNKAVFPIMTYAEMQFIKAEAELRKADKAAAYTAYLAGINAHFDFINRSYNAVRGANNLFSTTTLTAAARTKYLAGLNVKQTSTALTLSDVMLQKYIALWGWGFFETWVDLRRFHYIDLDPVTGTGQQVYLGFLLPSPLYSLNASKPVYRVRPHFTSEFTYNLSELQRLGINTNTYHTKEMWFSQP